MLIRYILCDTDLPRLHLITSVMQGMEWGEPELACGGSRLLKWNQRIIMQST